MSLNNNEPPHKTAAVLWHKLFRFGEVQHKADSSHVVFPRSGQYDFVEKHKVNARGKRRGGVFPEVAQRTGNEVVSSVKDMHARFDPAGLRGATSDRLVFYFKKK